MRSSDVSGIQGAGEADDDVEDLVDAAAIQEALEEFTEAWRFLGAL